MKYRFDQIAVNSTAKKVPVESDKEHYIGLEHLDSDNFTISRWGAEVAPVGEKLLMQKGDVLFGKRRAYQRKVGIAPFDGIFSAHGMVLRPNQDIVTKEFFPFFISSDQFMERAVRISVGGLSPTINWKDLKVQEFELPSIEEQRVLADKLWAAYRLKEAYRRLLTATQEMVKSRFIEMFGENPTNGKLRDCVTENKEKAKKKFRPTDIIRYIDISSVNADTNEVTSTTEYVFQNAPSRAQQCTRKGDILLSLVRPNLKNIAVNKDDADNLIASTGFCILHPKDDFSELLLATILSEKFTEQMMFVAKGTNYPAIHDYDALDYPMYIPNQEELKLFSDIYKQADKSEFELRKSIEAIDNVIKSLINNPTE